jgi:hypothetical protein
LSNKNIYKESHFVDFYKEVENYAYLQGLDFSDVSRMRSEVMIAFMAGLGIEETFDAVFHTEGEL